MSNSMQLTYDVSHIKLTSCKAEVLLFLNLKMVVLDPQLFQEWFLLCLTGMKETAIGHFCINFTIF